MQRLALSLALLMIAGAAVAQTPSNEQAPSPMYPAPPPLKAPEVDKGAPVGNLTSPLAADQTKPTQTKIDSEAEAQLFLYATKMSWGRYSKIKGAKPGTAVVTKQGPLWTIKGKLESVAPGTEGDWASIDGVVERIEAGKVQIRGEVAFRVAKIMNGAPCKVAGTMHFRRSGKSQVWRLVEGDNPCDGTQEQFDLIHDKPAEKKPVPAQGKRT
ncbi:MAG: hypothetical protein J0J01_06825 [Reyranella sp.]|uniref:hypothetical protein n=1 Tax=Reyranella sp. TaxID=1929291 RepID=UPI001AD0ABDB|nr:hypothetical protein [Reyranella sp.]MBN9086603.1 hypothetical protein [Reyranella sp.]